MRASISDLWLLISDLCLCTPMIQLSGQRLTLEQIAATASGQAQVTLADEARIRIENSRRVVEKIVADNRSVYGINTGFGKLSDLRIEPDKLSELQLNL